MTNAKFIFLIILIGLISSFAGLHFSKSTSSDSQNPQTALFFNSQSKSINNDNIALSRYKNTWLLVNFWASWCAPCREEIPDLNELANKNKKIKLVGIAIDEIEAVKKFLNKTPINYDSLIANDINGVEISKSLGNIKGVLPFTVLIAPNGEIQQAFYGKLDIMKLNQTLIKIIK